MKFGEENLQNALYKKALGFDTEEVVEEYQENDDEIVLVKRKVTRKNVPPDITAIKMLLDGKKSVSSLSDEELEKEKQRLLSILAQSEKGEKNEKDKKG